jgi:dolichol-phosphate mannosyltransferase
MAIPNQSKISIVIPAYNESGNIESVFEAISKTMSQELANYTYEIIFVDDGSTDNTLDIVKKLASVNPCAKYLSFSRNFGHQNALRAGLDHADGVCVISMDADLQHPPDFIPMMIEKWLDGVEIVYTRRKSSKETSLLKRTTSSFFYRVFNLLANIGAESGTADFRLLDRKVVEVLRSIQETHLFLRGMISWLGFNQAVIDYEVQERHSGRSKYSPRRMIGLGVDGVLAFSVRPLYLSILIGLFSAGVAVLYALYALFMVLFTDKTVPGWASVIMSVFFMGGVQLLMFGILGGYVGRMYEEVKQRPRYIITETNIERQTR